MKMRKLIYRMIKKLKSFWGWLSFIQREVDEIRAKSSFGKF